MLARGRSRALNAVYNADVEARMAETAANIGRFTQLVEAAGTTIAALRALVTTAMQTGEPIVPFKGDAIPVIQGTLDALPSLTGAVAPPAQASTGCKPDVAMLRRRRTMGTMSDVRNVPWH
jgi:hypothetical protein